jgi:hypothetical protein
MVFVLATCEVFGSFQIELILFESHPDRFIDPSGNRKRLWLLFIILARRVVVFDLE